MAHYAEEQEKANQNPTEYLANPINAYLLVKRLTTDWKNTEDLLQDDLYQGNDCSTFERHDSIFEFSFEALNPHPLLL